MIRYLEAISIEITTLADSANKYQAILLKHENSVFPGFLERNWLWMIRLKGTGPDVKNKFIFYQANGPSYLRHQGYV